ncbi:MAG: hypothetical protein ACR2RF_31625, partial [Geminicoccaceae bacterium]
PDLRREVRAGGEDALKMAIRNRRPPRGLIHHSERCVICELVLSEDLETAWPGTVHEPKGQLPRQRTDGEFLRLDEE